MRSLPAPDNISDSENLLRNPSGTFPTSPFLSLHFRVFLSLFEHELELLGRPESKDSRHASDISAVRTDPQAMERNIQVIRLSTDYCCRSECSYESISVGSPVSGQGRTLFYFTHWSLETTLARSRK